MRIEISLGLLIGMFVLTGLVSADSVLFVQLASYDSETQLAKIHIQNNGDVTLHKVNVYIDGVKTGRAAGSLPPSKALIYFQSLPPGEHEVTIKTEESFEITKTIIFPKTEQQIKEEIIKEEETKQLIEELREKEIGERNKQEAEEIVTPIEQVQYVDDKIDYTNYTYLLAFIGILLLVLIIIKLKKGRKPILLLCSLFVLVFAPASVSAVCCEDTCHTYGVCCSDVWYIGCEASDGTVYCPGQVLGVCLVCKCTDINNCEWKINNALCSSCTECSVSYAAGAPSGSSCSINSPIYSSGACGRCTHPDACNGMGNCREKPDLVPVSILPDPIALKQWDIEVTATIMNDGGIKADNFNVTLIAGNATRCLKGHEHDNCFVLNWTTLSLAAGESKDIKLNSSILEGHPPNHSISVWADFIEGSTPRKGSAEYEGKIPEVNEDNNMIIESIALLGPRIAYIDPDVTDIYITIDSEANLLFKLTNPMHFDQEVKLTIGGTEISYWSWFTGYRWTQSEKEMHITIPSKAKQAEGELIPVTVWGASRGGPYILTITAESLTIPEEISEATLNVYVVPTTGGLFGSIPGLNWFTFMILIIAAGILYMRHVKKGKKRSLLSRLRRKFKI